MNATFTFDIGQPVSINLNGRNGVVRGLWLDESKQQQIRVRYANEVGTVCDDWFRVDELTVSPAADG